jgi:iron complex outermembrane receptor protein
MSYEIGARGVVAGISFDVDAYLMHKDHYFFRDADGYNVPNGKTLHRGVELSFNAPLFWHFALDGSWTYAVHTYEFNRPVTSSATEVITKGNDMDSAPRVLGNLRLEWQPLSSLHTELQWTHVGRYYTDAANQHTYPGHDVLDLRASWQATDTLKVHGAIRNLTDVLYATRADYAFGHARYFPGETRAYEVGLEVAF